MIEMIKKRAENALTNYQALPPLLMKIEETITGACTGACPLMSEYYSFWQSRVEQALISMVYNSLTKL